MDKALTALSSYTNHSSNLTIALMMAGALVFAIAFMFTLARREEGRSIRKFVLIMGLSLPVFVAGTVGFIAFKISPDTEYDRLLATAQQAVEQDYGIAITEEALDSALSYNKILIKSEGDYVNVRLRESDGVWLFYEANSNEILQRPQV